MRSKETDMVVRKYASSLAFKVGLDTRLKATAKETGREAWRVRQLLIFERFLARVVIEFPDAIVLKGGLALELRLVRARTTKDVDIRFAGAPDSILPGLQNASRLELEDFMSFEVEVDKHRPEILAEEAKYGGKRFRVTCKIANQKYGETFGLDVGIADPMIRVPDELTMPNRLDFIGVAPPRLRIYPIETHVAEKLHAYTKLRASPSSRDKDLPDIALISTLPIPSSTTLQAAIAQTFHSRDTHPIPSALPPPPLYPQKAEDDDLEWPTLDTCYERACRFIDPVLEGIQESAWDPESGEWR
jgi:predicted nucleotidyltransferase component of viral defense system